MIKVVARNFIKEGKVENFMALAKKLMDETNRNDEGCIKYELFQDANDPNTFAFMEEWENKAAIDKHMAANHFQEIVPLIGALEEKQGEINLYKKVN